MWGRWGGGGWGGVGLIPGIKEKKRFFNEILFTRKNDIAIFL